MNPATASETAVLWNDGSAMIRTDRYGRTISRPVDDVPPGLCVVCWRVQCVDVRRDPAEPCAQCGDPARAYQSPLDTLFDAEAVEL